MISDVPAKRARRGKPPHAVTLAAPKATARPVKAAPDLRDLRAPEARTVSGPEENPILVGFQAFAAFGETQATLVRGTEALAGEVAVLIQAAVNTLAASAAAMLGAKTVAELVEIQVGLTRKNTDMALNASAEMTQIGIRFAVDTLQPLVPRLTDIRGVAPTG